MLCFWACREYESMSSISTHIQWQAVPAELYNQVPQYTAMLQSLLHIEAVWSLSVVRPTQRGKGVPMLKAFLDNNRFEPAVCCMTAVMSMLYIAASKEVNKSFWLCCWHQDEFAYI